jgi:hypothetical protein
VSQEERGQKQSHWIRTQTLYGKGYSNVWASISFGATFLKDSKIFQLKDQKKRVEAIVLFEEPWVGSKADLGMEFSFSQTFFWE